MQVLKESEYEERKEERTMTEIFWDAHNIIL